MSTLRKTLLPVVILVISSVGCSAADAPEAAQNTDSASPGTAPGADDPGLKLGEYACYGSGGRILGGLGFIVLPGNRYSDPDGDDVGSYSINGATVAFQGGHLDGQSGRDLRGHNFTIGSQAECEPY